MQNKNIQNFKTLCVIVAFTIFSSLAFSQNMTSATFSTSTPNDCTPFDITAFGTKAGSNVQFLGSSYSFFGGVLTVVLQFDNPPVVTPLTVNISHSVTVTSIPAGTYTVVVKSYRGTGLYNTYTSPTPLVVTSCCSADAIIAPLLSNTVCLDEDVTLISNSTNTTSVTWSLNSNVVSTSDTLIVSFPAAGVYTYELEASNGSCSETTSITITVDYIPPFNLGADTAICAGNAVSLNASSSVGGINYLWSSGQTTSSIVVTTTDVYFLTATLGACTIKDTIAVTVNPNPIINLGADTLLCAGETATLDGGVSNTTFLWSNGSTGSSLTVDSSAIYSVLVTDANGCEGGDAIQVTVNPEIVIGLMDTATINPSDAILLDAGLWASYIWSTGDTTQQIMANTGGIYTVTVTDASGCQSTDSIEITVVSAKSLAALPTLNVFPNPVGNQLRLENSDFLLNEAKVLIINNLGQVEKVTMLNNNETIDVSALAKGVYYLQIFNTQNQPIATARFVKL